MANTFELISSVTVGAGGQASIDFTSISNKFSDLCLKLSLRTDNAANYNSAFLKFNAVSSGYSENNLYCNASVTPVSLSNSASNQMDYLWIDAASATSSTFGNSEIYIPNYAGSSYKCVNFDIVTENNSSTTNSAFVGMMSGFWNNTAAINQVTITAGSSASFVQYSIASLYGIKNS